MNNIIFNFIDKIIVFLCLKLLLWGEILITKYGGGDI